MHISMTEEKLILRWNGSIQIHIDRARRLQSHEIEPILGPTEDQTGPTSQLQADIDPRDGFGQPSLVGLSRDICGNSIFILGSRLGQPMGLTTCDMES